MIVRIILFLSTFAGATAHLWLGNSWLSIILGSILVWCVTFVTLSALAFGFLWLCSALVDFDKPQETDAPFYRALVYHYSKALIDLLQIRIETRGLEKIPQRGRFLLVCNHQHEADPGVIMYYMRHSGLVFISKQESKDMFLMGKLMYKLRAQFINRENDRQGLRIILNCIDLMKRDEASIAVFPEGGIKIEGKLSPFRPGVFKMALKANVPIVVCTIQNTQFVLRNGLKLKPTDVKFHVLDVIQPEQFAGMKTTQISDMVHAMMAQDLGPDFLLEECQTA